MDPIGLLSVDVCDLLWSDAVQHRDLLRQVQQRQLVQVQRLVDCREDKGQTIQDCIRSQAHSQMAPSSLRMHCGKTLQTNTA